MTLMYREKLPLFEINEITPDYMSDMQGTPIENDKQVQLSVFNHRENKRTEINVSIPEKINLDLFKQRMYSVVEAKVDCKDNVAWTGNGRVGVYGSVYAAGEASFTADQVYSFLSIRYYGNRVDLSEYDSLIREKEYQKLIESVLANGVPNSKGGVSLTVFKASNINGEFKGVFSPELSRVRRIPGETFEVSYTPFFNGSLSLTNGGFDGDVSINLKELEFKSIGDVIVKRLPKEFYVWFRADQVSYNGKFNYTYITLSGNTVGQSHFEGMGGLLNLTFDNSWIHFDRYGNQFFRSDRLIAIIPLLLLFSFFVFFMVKNKKKYLKYFKYRSVENKN
ncbi:hypothetical protein HDV04_005215 [Boothiomyces sp. JEL0838]|nr:hypothetical protein HDV04_005215 [Boothiomyces sp. JEL0838]